MRISEHLRLYEAVFIILNNNIFAIIINLFCKQPCKVFAKKTVSLYITNIVLSNRIFLSRFDYKQRIRDIGGNLNISTEKCSINIDTLSFRFQIVH